MLDFKIPLLIKEYHLPSKTIPFLESIAYQEKEANFNVSQINLDLRFACEIAARYAQSVSALQKLDSAMERYLQRSANEKLRVGNFGKLNEHEKYLVAKGLRLVLNGLESRIEEVFLGCDNKTPKKIPRECKDDDDVLENWQENSLRHLEG